MPKILFTNNITDIIIHKLVNCSKTDSLLLDMRPEIIQRISDYSSLGPTVAAMTGETILGIGGVGKIHTGVGIAWLVISMEFTKYPKSMLKMCRQIIDEAFICMNFHRIQMDIDSTYPENGRFSSMLGFHCEGIMVKYGSNKKDYYRYVRLRD